MTEWAFCTLSFKIKRETLEDILFNTLKVFDKSPFEEDEKEPLKGKELKNIIKGCLDNKEKLQEFEKNYRFLFDFGDLISKCFSQTKDIPDENLGPSIRCLGHHFYYKNNRAILQMESELLPQFDAIASLCRKYDLIIDLECTEDLLSHWGIYIFQYNPQTDDVESPMVVMGDYDTSTYHHCNDGINQGIRIGGKFVDFFNNLNPAKITPKTGKLYQIKSDSGILYMMCIKILKDKDGREVGFQLLGKDCKFYEIPMECTDILYDVV